jgi:hypothetical protein
VGAPAKGNATAITPARGGRFPRSRDFLFEKGWWLLEEIRLSARWRSEEDEWIAESEPVTSTEGLARLQEAMESRGSVLVAHWRYRGGAAPVHSVFDVFEDFVAYLHGAAAGGDALDIWLVQELCTPANRFVQGKVPDLDGCTPRKGSY